MKKKSDLMEPSLATIVILLSSNAMGYLEAAQDKEKEDRKKENLDLATFFIDLLAVLEEKTKGNLAEEEKMTLEKVLTELRMLYVKLSR
ncbi:MAG TPA: DUF1844 domain-containing protein [archaeon]|nr:DUF1844 domain-containing protein [archaeon]